MSIGDILRLQPGDTFQRLGAPVTVKRIKIVPLAGESGVDQSYLELIHSAGALYHSPIRPNLELTEFSRES